MLNIRLAESADIDRISEVMHGAPGGEPLAVAGNAELATRFGDGLLRLEQIPSDDKPTIVAVDGERIVGVLQYSVGGTDGRITRDQVKLALSVFGLVGVLQRLPKFRARSKVELPIPPGSLYIAELHVDPQRRGEGIGGQLLSWAADEARRRGIMQMSLHTTTSNPARRLYARHGFVVTKTALDSRYERHTGIAGRVLMERNLEIAAS